MRTMRVVVATDEPWDSGLSRYALDAAGELRRLGHDVRVWARAGTLPYKGALEAGLAVVDCSRPWLRLAELRAELKRHRTEILNPHTGAAHSLAVFLARTLSPRPAVVRTRSAPRPIRRRPLARRLLELTDAHVCANASLAAALERAYPGLPGPREVIPGGVDLEAFPALPFPERPCAGMIARLDPVKGHADLLRAHARARRAAPGAELWLAGREENVKISALARLARELGLDGSVHLMGHVESLEPVLSVCQVGVVASLGSEAVSRAALEWMASGRPVVATAVGGLPELVEDGITGLLVAPGDPDALGDALAALLADPARARRMGLKARERVEERFGLAALGRRTESLLASVLERRENAFR